jgi:hypothetical protein
MTAVMRCRILLCLSPAGAGMGARAALASAVRWMSSLLNADTRVRRVAGARFPTKRAETDHGGVQVRTLIAVEVAS